ncbi:MAG: hypothetical protein H7Y36_12220 [Armatimonadetes bacterium]|nr:hypothetical protein [Akkermansiaceae bacterium]
MKTPRSKVIRSAIIALLIGGVYAAPMPTTVEIVPVGSDSSDTERLIGNVRVRFADGHSELWTRQGRCLLAKVTKNGLIGWTRFGERNRRGVPVNDSIRLMVSTEHWVDFRSGYPFIDDWDTSADGAALIVRSGFAHGPFRFERFDLRTQKLLEQTTEKPYAELPAWARPLATDQPKP